MRISSILSLGNPVMEPPAEFHRELRRLAEHPLPGMHRYFVYHTALMTGHWKVPWLVSEKLPKNSAYASSSLRSLPLLLHRLHLSLANTGPQIENKL